MRLNVHDVFACAVAVRSGSFLLVRRAAPEGALVWQFPTGKVDSDEKPLVAAAREVAETAWVP